MSTPKFNLSDPRLTAYALGELGADETKQIEQWLETSPAGREHIQLLRELCSTVSGALQAESVMAPSPRVQAAIDSALAGTSTALAEASSEAGLTTTALPATAVESTRNRSLMSIAGLVGAVALVVTASVTMQPSGPSHIAKNADAVSAPNVTPHFFGDLTSDFSTDLGESEKLADPSIALRSVVNGDGTTVTSGGVQSDDLSRLHATLSNGPAPQPGAAKGKEGKNIESSGGGIVKEVEDLRLLLTEEEHLVRGGVSGKQTVTEFGLVTPQNSSLGRPTSFARPNILHRFVVPGNGTNSGNGQEKTIAEQQLTRAYTTNAPTQEQAPAPAPITATPVLVDGEINGGTATDGRRLPVDSLATRLSSQLAEDADRPVGLTIQQPRGLSEGVPLGWRSANMAWDDGSWAFSSAAASKAPAAVPYFAYRSKREFFELKKRTYQAESYAPIVENEFLTPKKQPYSTFSIDVDSGAYANVRRFLHNNELPPPNAVRLEELVNAFSYDFKQPTKEHPVVVTLDAMPCPWNVGNELVRVGIKAKEFKVDENRPPTSLVFLIDVSGSMSNANKLPLAQSALRLLVEEMGEDDRIAIVTYSNEAVVALPSTNGANKDVILEKIDSLNASGGTNGESGLQLAYKVATENLIEKGANRVLVCTDGDFNIGNSSDQDMFELIEDKRKTNVFLSVFGFGSGNLKDSKLEGIANRGNGHYSYIDRLEEAHKLLVEQLTGTLYTVAKDVKLQVEFNPAHVASYRLLGYENRMLAAQDFNNDRVDAGEMGAGHTVTALYEVVPMNKKTAAETEVDAPRYSEDGKETAKPANEDAEEATDGVKKPAIETKVSPEMMFVKLRYKQPTSDESTKLEIPLILDGDRKVLTDQAWAANVASFGMLLRNSKYKGSATWDDLLKSARAAHEAEPSSERLEFIDLVLRARGLDQRSKGVKPATPPEMTSLNSRDRARCGERYQLLLDKVLRPEDLNAFGHFYEFGYRKGDQFEGASGLPDGHWVYVYPHWYIWEKSSAMN